MKPPGSKALLTRVRRGRTQVTEVKARTPNILDAFKELFSSSTLLSAVITELWTQRRDGQSGVFLYFPALSVC